MPKNEKNQTLIFGRQLMILMAKKGTSTAVLARAAGVSTKTVYQWLNHHQPRHFEQVKKVADFFGVTLDFLLFGQSPSEDSLEKHLRGSKAGEFELVLKKPKIGPLSY